MARNVDGSALSERRHASGFAIHNRCDGKVDLVSGGVVFCAAVSVPGLKVFDVGVYRHACP